MRTADQLIQAIGSNRTITVIPGTYQLDAVTRTDTKHVRWTKVHDGWQLHIRNVSNLSIVGGPGAKPRLLVGARYAWVIKFDDARSVVLRNLVLGHIPQGGCVGGVVAFARARNIQIINSELFGSGTIGVGLDRVVGFHMASSTIRDCTYGILSISKSANVRFTRSSFRHNKEFDLIEINDTRDVRFERCIVEGNRTGRGSGYALFKLDKRSSVSLHGGSYRNNTLDTFVNRPRQLRVLGSKSFRASIDLKLHKADPRFNQIYKVLGYRQWIVTGSQAGIVFWNPATGQVDLLEKSFISNTFLVKGGFLWAGTYNNVFRFDGVNIKRYLHTANARGHAVFRGPKGGVWVRQGRRYWRYDGHLDRLVAATPRWAPAGSPYDIHFDGNGARWSINFLRGIQRDHGGTTRDYKLQSPEYAGRDPRSFFQAANGELWVTDFSHGFFRYDAGADKFVRDPTVTAKGVGIAVDGKRKRTWLGHYTDGVHLVRPGKPSRFFDFRNLQNMRAIHADQNGALWIGGWTGLVRLHRSRGKWLRQPFVLR